MTPNCAVLKCGGGVAFSIRDADNSAECRQLVDGIWLKSTLAAIKGVARFFGPDRRGALLRAMKDAPKCSMRVREVIPRKLAEAKSGGSGCMDLRWPSSAAGGEPRTHAVLAQESHPGRSANAGRHIVTNLRSMSYSAIMCSLTPPREIAERKAAFPRLFPIARNSPESFLSFSNLSMVDFIL